MAELETNIENLPGPAASPAVVYLTTGQRSINASTGKSRQDRWLGGKDGPGEEQVRITDNSGSSYSLAYTYT